MAGWTRCGDRLRPREVAVGDARSEPDLLRGRSPASRYECALLAAIHDLPARPWLVHPIAAADGVRLEDRETGCAARSRRGPCLQDRETRCEPVRRTVLEHHPRRTSAEV